MKQTAHFVTADLGASSGRIMLGEWNGRAFSVQELHRFANAGVRAAGSLYWDILGIWSQIKAGLRKYHVACPQSPQGIAVDAWGVDFGLLDGGGRLIGNPVHYRDSSTEGMPQVAFKTVPEREWFARDRRADHADQYSVPGLQHGPRGMTRAWLGANAADDSRPLHISAERRKTIESSEAATTQMYSARRSDWARSLLGELHVPVDILPAVTAAGTVLSPVRAEVLADCGFTRSFPAIAVGSHDTASAVAAIPNMDEHSVFLSSGTWSLMGVEARGARYLRRRAAPGLHQ